MMKDRRNYRRATLTAIISGALVLLFTACGSTAESTNTTTATTQTQAEQLHVSDVWAKAAPQGDMSALFATIVNQGAQPVTIEFAESPVSDSMQLHETVADSNGSTMMQEKQGGFTIEAGNTLSLEPGGDHIMFMALTQDLVAGDDVQVTVTMADGSSLVLDGPVREYDGAQESYMPEHAMSGDDTDTTDEHSDESATQDHGDGAATHDHNDESATHESHDH